MTNKQMKRSSNSLVVKEIPTETTIDIAFHIYRMTQDLKDWKYKELEGCRTTGTQIKAHESIKLYSYEQFGNI